MASLPQAARPHAEEFVTNWPLVGTVATLFGLVLIALSVPFWLPAADTSPQVAALNSNTAQPPTTGAQSTAAPAPRVDPPPSAPLPLALNLRPQLTAERLPIVVLPPILKAESQTVSAPAITDLAVAADGRPSKIKPTAGSAAKPPVDDPAELLRDLSRHAVLLDLRADKGAVETLLKQKDSASSARQELVNHLSQRSDLAGLPLRGEEECEHGPEKTKLVKEISTGLRAFDLRRGRPDANDHESHSFFLQQVQEREQDLARALVSRNGASLWEQDAAVSTLVQMLQVESEVVRLKLVERLRAMKGSAASMALAERALFDVSSEVRRLAFLALRERPAREYQSRLIEGLRYPWPPVAQHAAEALAAIGDRSAISRIAPLVDEPDPRRPWLREDKKWVVKELAAVNHMRNCLLCHSPSRSEKDLVRGLVPTPGEPLPVVYYAGQSGTFVSGDAVYLKQDFSAVQTVSDPGKWPAEQRFDYFVRIRELTAAEVAKLPTTAEPREASYPQRESVLLALRQLESPVVHTTDPAD